MLLEHFQEDPAAATSDGPCCDVCEGELLQDEVTKQIELVVRTVQDMPGYGEVKVSVPNVLTYVHVPVDVLMIHYCDVHSSTDCRNHSWIQKGIVECPNVRARWGALLVHGGMEGANTPSLDPWFGGP